MAQQSTDFRGDYDAPSHHTFECAAESLLGETKSVDRCRIEVTNSKLKRPTNNRGCLVIGHCREEIPEWAGAETQTCDLDARITYRDVLERDEGLHGSRESNQATALTGLPLNPGTSNGRAAKRTR